ncbi:ATP-dependent protease [Chromatiales bacterium (ex Bugula neritina AB1)]|nr:ATP-dependent protease [Chromatiales bacterium (ex Bugula neritina AB1)]
MNLAVVNSRALIGVSAVPVSVEVHLAGGLPALSIVGMPETAVRESKDRVRAAMLNSGFDFPARRITVNLAPADLPKSGGRFDLPIALGLLAASGQLDPESLANFEFIGELALGGELRSVEGVLPTAIAAQSLDRSLVLPLANAIEASLAEGCRVYGCLSLLQLCNHLAETGRIEELRQAPVEEVAASGDELNLEDVRGQHQARRALEVAAAGGHNLLLVGPPGTGKSMLASRLPGILPPMTLPEALETASIASISRGGLEIGRWRTRPYRAPHHTSSGVALVGGGSQPKPGEVSLAHNGVLFLDELPEFTRSVLDVLREPVENGTITISRAGQQAEFPARIQLVAAMNPCPCGYYGDSKEPCRCGPEMISRYQSRVSGPLLDRIDIQISVQRIEYALLRSDARRGEDSMAVARRVADSHILQLARAGKSNAHLNAKEVEQYCTLSENQHEWLAAALEKFNLSARAIHRTLKVARTIADLSESSAIEGDHLREALSYRSTLNEQYRPVK